MTIVLAAPLVLPILPPDRRATYSETCTALPFLLLTLGTFWWRLSESTGRERRFWAWLSAGVGCWLVQQVVLIGIYLLPPTVANSLLEEVFYVGLYLFLVLALDVRPHLSPGTESGGALGTLRRTGAAVFVIGALAYFVLIPATLDPESYWAGVPSFTFYVVLDGYLVLRLVGARSASVERRWRSVYGWLLVTCAAWLVLDTIEALMWTEVLPWIGPGTPWDLPWMVPLITLVLTGRVPAPAEERDGVAAARRAPDPESAQSRGSPMILLAILIPLLHFTVYGFGLFDETTRRAHELLALALLVVLGSLVFAYQRGLERRNRRLEEERSEALARSEHRAHHDPLTGLPNRRLLEDRVAQATAQADRRGERVAILFFDLDGFKVVNDTSGHAVGDELLRRIGQRLASRVRSSDTLARLGGDEFVIVVSNVETRATAARLATEIRRSLDAPFEVEGGRHTVSASVGVSLYPDDGSDVATLLHHADRAMYRAKEEGPPTS